MTRLILRYPNNVIKEVSFDQSRYRVGSADDNDLVIEQEGVSPHQAEIEQAGGAYSIVDVSEDKSTAVNGKPVERSNLNYGDRISFGPVSGLFYPVKRSRISDKAKLFLYMGAGALVIVVSIVLVFFLTSRQMSTILSESIGEGIVTEKGAGYISDEKRVPEKKEKAVKKEKAIVLPALKRGSSRTQRPENVKLNLPEPGSQTIETRTAVAVPRGIGRIFFRKIPVVVEGEKQASVITGETETQQDVAFEKGEEKRGIFQKILSPVNRLLRAETKPASEEAVPEEYYTSEEGIAPKEGPEIAVAREEVPTSERRSAEEVAKEDVERILNPLSALSTREIPEISDVIFKEEPLYGEEVGRALEGEKAVDEGALPDVLSQAENLNIDLLWKYPEGLEKLEPIVRAGTVMRFEQRDSYVYLFGTRGGNLVAVSGKGGEEIFSEAMGKPFYDPVAVYLGDGKLKRIIIAFEDGDIAVYTVNLERVLFYKGNDSITSIPLIIDVSGDKVPDIIFTTFNMDVVALDGKTGFELWRFFDAESEVVNSPVGADINNDSVLDVVFCTRMGWLYALDGRTGWSLWKREIFGIPAGPPSIADLDGDKNDEIVTLTKNGFLSSYGKDGKLLFTLETGSVFIVAPSIGDIDRDRYNEMVFIDTNGVVKVLEGKTRREEWSFETEEGGILGRIALADVDNEGGLDVIFCTYSGVLFVLDGKSGTLIAQYNLASHCFSTPIVADINKDGVSDVLLGSYAGELFSLKVSDAKKKLLPFRRSFWISSNHDYKNTGASPSYFLKNPWK